MRLAAEPTAYHRLFDCPEPVDGRCHCVPPREDFDGSYDLGAFDGGRFQSCALLWVERANARGFCMRDFFREMDEAYAEHGRKLEQLLLRESPMLAALRRQVPPQAEFLPCVGAPNPLARAGV